MEKCGIILVEFIKVFDIYWLEIVELIYLSMIIVGIILYLVFFFYNYGIRIFYVF